MNIELIIGLIQPILSLIIGVLALRNRSRLVSEMSDLFVRFYGKPLGLEWFFNSKLMSSYLWYGFTAFGVFAILFAVLSFITLFAR